MPITIITTSSDFTGTDEDEAIVAVASGGTQTIDGGDGHDTIVAGLPFVFADDTSANGSRATATNIDNAAWWSTADSPMVADSSIPYISIFRTATTPVHSDWFAVTLDAGQTITVDVDLASGGFLSHSDLGARLTDAAGTQLAFDGDSTMSEGGGGSISIDFGDDDTSDPYLTYTAVTAGIYYINIGGEIGGNTTTLSAISGNRTYLANVSVTGHAATAVTNVNDMTIIDGGEENGRDNLYGTNGVDRIVGNRERDYLFGFGGDDFLMGGNHEDYIDGGDGFDWASYEDAFFLGVVVSLAITGPQQTQSAGEDILVGIEGLIGSVDGDTLTGNDGVNFFRGLGGSDTLNGGLGDDTFQVTDGTGFDQINGGGDIDTLDLSLSTSPWTIDFFTNSYTNALGDSVGLNSIERVIGGQGDDVFIGTISGGIDGGAGSDTLDLTPYNLSGSYAINLATGVNSNGVETLGFENFTAGGTTQDMVAGTDGANVLRTGAGNDVLGGGEGNDTLDGGLGADQMYGGPDNDTYHVDNTGDRVNEDVDQGIDSVVSAITFELGATVENLTLTGSGNLSGAGNALANVLIGNSGNNWLVGLAGNDTLDGGLGADRMDGGADDDAYYVDNTGDRANELAGGGTDLVYASITFELGANLENLTLTGSGNTAGAGNALANVLTGNSGNNWLVGLAGNDTLDGGLGADKMEGGADNDTYYVDNTGDRANENANQGTDQVFASITFELGANVENLTLTGSGNTAGGGNALANVLTGNSGNNWLAGVAGNDTLDGGLGADRMDGGADNDTYYVDNTGDRVNEKVNEGTDLVLASISFELGANVENLTLTGSGPTSGAGNVLANVLTGNGGNNWLVGLAGNDTLDGGLGADKMDGGANDDTYYVDNAGDKANEKLNEGTDQVFASISFELGANVENLTLTGSGNSNGGGNALANVLIGNTGENWLVGQAGNDVLDGGLGADRLDGGADQDVFAFTSALGAGNIDRITGFVAADDTIQLDDAVFGGLAAGALAAGAYNTGTAATQADDRIIYNANTGVLLFDADGLGGAAAVQFALLNLGLTLTSADFVVI